MNTQRGLAEDTVVVILAAGKGTRAGRTDLVKVCFEIDAVPAINRTISTFKKKRFHRFLLVVGGKADQVIEAVEKEHSGVLYVYQTPPLGTGHAAKVAAEALRNLGYDGHVLVTMGDKFIEEEAIDALLDGFVKQQADMALLTLPKTGRIGSQGRVFLDQTGQALDIVEAPDLARQSIVDELKRKIRSTERLPAAKILEVVDRKMPSREKQAVAVGRLLAMAGSGDAAPKKELEAILDSDEYNLTIDGRRYTAKEIERLAKGANPSLYLFRAEAFYEGVRRINNRNAQGEYYLTDVIKCLSGIRDNQARRRYRVRTVEVDHPEWVQGFNSPDELVAIQDHVRRKNLLTRKRRAAERQQLKPSQYATVRQWLEKLKKKKPSLVRWLRNIYGRHDRLHAEKCKELAKVLLCYGKRFGMEQKVCIVRAPGQANLMGRHVDHRGGPTNFLAIDRETLAVAGLREDQTVAAVNTDPKRFPAVEFNIAELLGRFAWSDWLNFIDSDWVQSMLRNTQGDWGNYIKAPVLRLQNRFQDVKLRGMNVAIHGTIPIAAGLSSSSTIVVAALQAAIALNNFALATQQFIDLSGEGEWFVGSRGGPGDHAAIYLGRRGKIAHVSHIPFRVEKIVDAPEDYQFLIANSHVQATRDDAAQHTFNTRLASYSLGLTLLKQRCPEICRAVEHVRDISPARLGWPTSEIYRMLLRVPQFMTRREIAAALHGPHRETIEVDFATHPEPKHYRLRGVLLFGAAEIMRSQFCPELLEAGRVEEFGALMKISHDGDRVSRPGPDGRYFPVQDGCTDEYLNRLVTDLGSEDPQRVLRAQLYMQPGSYACSTPAIDQMVDIACSVPGVAGTQLAGAGLGGCIMILAAESAAAEVQQALVRRYYEPSGLEPAMFPCVATEGAGLVEF